MNKFISTIYRSLPHPLIYYSYKILRHKKFQLLQNLREKEVSGYEYSLKGFDELQCIYIHIPKTGGVSLSLSLFGNLGGGHRSVEDYFLIFSPKIFSEYFKFTIVRNPWDRMVSAYFFLKEGGFHDTEKEWFEENLSLYNDFEEFVTKWVTKKNVYNYNHFIPQNYFICHKNKQIVDKVYRLENISSAIKDINSKLNINVILSHKNKTNKRDPNYRKYYNSRTRNIVSNVYQKDIELFDYHF